MTLSFCGLLSPSTYLLFVSRFLFCFLTVLVTTAPFGAIKLCPFLSPYLSADGIRQCSSAYLCVPGVIPAVFVSRDKVRAIWLGRRSSARQTIKEI